MSYDIVCLLGLDYNNFMHFLVQVDFLSHAVSNNKIQF